MPKLQASPVGCAYADHYIARKFAGLPQEKAAHKRKMTALEESLINELLGLKHGRRKTKHFVRFGSLAYVVSITLRTNRKRGTHVVVCASGAPVLTNAPAATRQLLGITCTSCGS